jgi:hypothetical protein
MALGDNYATLAELKSYLTISTTQYDTELTAALNSASREIERYARRQFNDAGSATSRVYYPQDAYLVVLDDFFTTSGLVVETDSTDSGAFDQTWTSADYQPEPLNQVRNGYSGWPYWKIRAVESLTFPDGRRPTVRVTARWGWASVPAPVKQACLILAAKTFQIKDSPLGVAGFGEFGVVRVQDDRMAMAKLMPFCRDRWLVA